MIPANMIPVNTIFDSDLHRRTEVQAALRDL